MKTKAIDIVSRVSGEHVTAELMICSRCNGEHFQMYLVAGHIHMQCVHCGESFCQAGDKCPLPGKVNRQN
jgi:hypothetical protein